MMIGDVLECSLCRDRSNPWICDRAKMVPDPATSGPAVIDTRDGALVHVGTLGRLAAAFAQSGPVGGQQSALSRGSGYEAPLLQTTFFAVSAFMCAILWVKWQATGIVVSLTAPSDAKANCRKDVPNNVETKRPALLKPKIAGVRVLSSPAHILARYLRPEEFKILHEMRLMDSKNHSINPWISLFQETLTYDPRPVKERAEWRIKQAEIGGNQSPSDEMALCLPTESTSCRAKSASWKLDKKPSLSSLSSSSLAANSNDFVDTEVKQYNPSTECLAIANDQFSKTMSGKRRRVRRSRQRSKKHNLSSGALSIPLEGGITSPPVFWPPVAPPPGLALRSIQPPPGSSVNPPLGLSIPAPPGLDSPRLTSLLRPDAPSFSPNKIPERPAPPSFLFPLPPNAPPAYLVSSENHKGSRPERSSTMASDLSSRTGSVDGDALLAALTDGLARLVRGGTMDEGHDADDENEGFYDEEPPSVDLSFLE